MQERYLGDSHDYLKYALLRHLHAKLDLRLGINWYLTSPEEVDLPGNNDGEKRHHLKGGVWQATDPDLFERIHRFDTPSNRLLANVAQWGLLPPDTLYFDQPVSMEDRLGWHLAGVRTLGAADLVFLDPDNGFEVKSMSARTRAKYALFEEIGPYLDAGKAVLAIQFARQCDPVQRALEVRDRLMARYGASADLPVIRGRVAPNLLFFTLVPAGAAGRMEQELHSFVTKCAKVELIAGAGAASCGLSKSNDGAANADQSAIQAIELQEGDGSMKDELTPTEEGEPALPKARSAPACFSWSWAITIAGALLCFLGLRAQTTAEDSDTLNIGLLQDQMMLVQSGVALLCTGILAFFFSKLVDVLEQRG